MRVQMAAPRGGRLGGPLAAVIVAGAVIACSGPASSTSAPAVSCTNYAIHGSGKYHDEVWVRVSVSNTSSRSVRYVVDVNLTPADPAGTGAPATRVTITGLGAANSPAELSRKVLTVGRVQHCEITRLSQS